MAKSHYKHGDRCRLIDIETLRAISMGDHLDKIVTLDKQLTSDEKKGRGMLMDRYKHDEVWWVKVDSQFMPYYVPVKCLLLVDSNNQPSANTHVDDEIAKAKQCGCWYGNCKETHNKKETDSMYLYNITIIRTPSALAQQAGEIDEIIAGPTPVLAKDEAACLKAGAHAELIPSTEIDASIIVWQVNLNP